MAKLTVVEKLKRQVELGAAFLNVVNPNWFKEINPKELNMASAKVCILGELYGNYHNGVKELRLRDEMPENMGFHADHKGRYLILNKFWKSKVRALRRKNT